MTPTQAFEAMREAATEAQREITRLRDRLDPQDAEIARLRAKVATLQNAIRQLVPGQPDETDEA